jgi:hypothetical protein
MIIRHWFFPGASLPMGRDNEDALSQAGRGTSIELFCPDITQLRCSGTVLHCTIVVFRTRYMHPGVDPKYWCGPEVETPCHAYESTSPRDKWCHSAINCSVSQTWKIPTINVVGEGHRVVTNMGMIWDLVTFNIAWPSALACEERWSTRTNISHACCIWFPEVKKPNCTHRSSFLLLLTIVDWKNGGNERDIKWCSLRGGQEEAYSQCLRDDV